MIEEQARAAWQKVLEQQNAEEQQAKQKKEDEKEINKQNLISLLRESLAQEFLLTLHVFIHAEPEWHETYAWFDCMDARWHLKPYGYDWLLHCEEQQRGYFPAGSFPRAKEQAQETILAHLGRFQAAKEKEAAEDAEQEQEQAENRKMVEERLQEKQKRIKEADAEHNRLEVIIAGLRLDAKRSLWRWPEGKQITLYLARWFIGGVRDDGGVYPQFDHGWLKHLPNTEGRIDLEQEIYADARVMHLYWESAVPSFQECTFSSVEELPDNLKTMKFFRPDHIWQQKDEELDDTYRLVEADDLSGFYSAREYSEGIGMEPIGWLKAYIAGE